MDYKAAEASFSRIELIFSDVEYEDETMSLENPITVFEKFTEANETQDEELMMRCLRTITVFLISGVPIDDEAFGAHVASVLSSLIVTDSEWVPLMAIQLVTAVQTHHSDLMPDIYSDDFVQFCMDLIQSEPEMSRNALICLRNLNAYSDEYRDRVMALVPVEYLENEIISNSDIDSDVRGEAMNLVCCYAQYPVDEETGLVILNLCRSCLEQLLETDESISTNQMISSSLWTLVLLLETCPSIMHEITDSPFPEAIEVALHGCDPHQLIPALQLTKFLFMSDLEIPDESHQNFLNIITHVDSTVSENAYEPFKELIVQKPHVIERFIPSLMDTLEDIMQENPCEVKLKAADLFCTVCLSLSNDNFTEFIASQNRIVWFVDLLEYDDPDLQLQLLRILNNLINSLETCGGFELESVLKQIHESGGLKVLEDLVDEEGELGELADIIGTRVNDFALQEEDDPPEIQPAEAPQKRGVRRVRLWKRRKLLSDDSDTDASYEEEEATEKPPVRPQLWKRQKVPSGDSDTSYEE